MGARGVGGTGNGRYLMCHKDGPLEGKKIVVVGKGPLGLLTALDVAAQGATVIMISAHPLGCGVGFVNAAGLHEPVATDDPDATRHFLYGLELWRWAQPDPAWGLQNRRVLFMSDHAANIHQPWITALPSARLASDHELPREGPAFGIWFDTFVLQPERTLVALRRELERFEIKIDPGKYRFRTCRQAVEHAKKLGADALVLAAGIGLADFDDVWDIDGLGEWLGLTGGLGATKKIARKLLPSLDYVLMDVDTIGYLIPQIEWVIAGGTNHRYEPWEPMIGETKPTPEMITEVEEKIDRLWPGTAALPGKWLLGARPMRDTILKHYLERDFFGIPVVLLGGAGGSGWTFCASLAADVSGLLIDELESGTRLPVFPETIVETEGIEIAEGSVSIDDSLEGDGG